jgi:uncharacterized protein YlxW (UPF0749 family)
MTEPQFSGPATPGELLAYIIRLARDTREGQKDAQLVRQEVRTALAKFEETMKAVLTKTEAIQKSYAPDSVKEAVRAASGVLDRFKGESEGTLIRLTTQADRVSSTLLLRTMMWALATSICLVVAGGIAVKIAPNPIEIADRRAELQGLQNQIAATNRRVEALKDSLILGTDGRWYLRYAPTSTFCPDPKRPEACASYVPFP